MLCCIHLHLCTTAKSSVRFMENYLSNGCNLWLLKLPELYFSEAERVLFYSMPIVIFLRHRRSKLSARSFQFGQELQFRTLHKKNSRSWFQKLKTQPGALYPKECFNFHEAACWVQIFSLRREKERSYPSVFPRHREKQVK